MSNEAMIELQQTAITAQNDLIIEKTKNINMNNKLNAALRCLLKIRETYPHVYNECLSEDDLRAVLGPR
jgi:hypothetical protein